MFGVEGTLKINDDRRLRKDADGITREIPGTITTQVFSARRNMAGNDAFKALGYTSSWVTVEVRFDDQCGNGHNSLGITGQVGVGRDPEACGQVTEAIAAAFPELSELMPWHLTSTDGPVHYVENTVYLAGDRDHNGRLEGEPFAFKTHIVFGDNPIVHKFSDKFIQFLQDDRSGFDFEVIAISHKDRATFGEKYTFGGYGVEWHYCPFDTEGAALNFLTALQTCAPRFVSAPTQWGKGKARELDAARRSAVWPEATDAELSVSKEELTAALEARLPKLLEKFRDVIHRAGLQWEGMPR